MLIKICGITDPDIAAFAAKNGAHFIGFVMTPGYRRSVSLEQGKAIAEAARAAGAEPVALFVGADKRLIEETCRLLLVDRVQAYGLNEPLNLKRFYVNEPDAQIGKNEFFLIEKNDFLPFLPPKAGPWIIAGGLTPENVKETILKFRPDGVDVSSGVEKEGKKDRELILKFIEEVLK